MLIERNFRYKDLQTRAPSRLPEIKGFLQFLKFRLPIKMLCRDDAKHYPQDFHFLNPGDAQRLIRTKPPGPQPHCFSFGAIQFGTGAPFNHNLLITGNKSQLIDNSCLSFVLRPVDFHVQAHVS